MTVLELRDRGRTPFTLPDADAWMEAAVCRGLEPTVFFGPDERWAQEENWVPAAKAICATCPVRRDCLSYAIRNRIRVGVFGGLVPMERARIRLLNGGDDTVEVRG
jgi:WhiB family redox-sensing transcriptional regulator